MKTHKTKIVIAAVVVLALVGAWVLGSAPTNVPSAEHPPAAVAVDLPQPSIAATSPLSEITPSEVPLQATQDDSALAINEELTSAEDIPDDAPVEEASQPESPNTPDNAVFPEQPPSETADALPLGDDHPEQRAPVEPEDMTVSDDSFTVTLSVRAHVLLYNMHLLHVDKHDLVPEGGWIFPPTEATAYEGESVFNVLQREMRRNRIHMASRFTPMFNSAYVEAINNLYEFDAGPLSGWMYRVNGWFPNFGSSRYLLSPGDMIEWVYTVDLGREFGACLSDQHDD